MSGYHLDPLKLEIALETLRHLGMNLYGSMPPVISELIANAYDARARKVDITITKNNVSIEDDGVGMDRAAVQSKYLIVGRDRRVDDPPPPAADDPFSDWPRREKPMGRKGIGKLAMFSIANEAVISSVQLGRRVSFRMTRKGIEDAASQEGGNYHPEELEGPDNLATGTRVVLSDFRRATPPVPAQLRKAIARRFSVIDLDGVDDQHEFQIFVDGEPITAQDWDVFGKLQFMWCLGASSQHYISRCGNLKRHIVVDPALQVPGQETQEINGWIGTVAAPKNLITSVAEMKLNDNRIVVDCRGKVAIANFLHQFGEAGVYASYLAGYIRADFLDDNMEDIATSDRERMREDDPRVDALVSFVRKLLKRIEGEWRDLRIENERMSAEEDPIIGAWLETLGESE